jgi:hypothetical protein
MVIDFLLDVFRHITQRTFSRFLFACFLSTHVCIEQSLTITYHLTLLWFSMCITFHSICMSYFNLLGCEVSCNILLPMSFATLFLVTHPFASHIVVHIDPFLAASYGPLSSGWSLDVVDPLPLLILLSSKEIRYTFNWVVLVGMDIL